MMLRYLVFVIFQGHTVSAGWVWKKSSFLVGSSVPHALYPQGLTPLLSCVLNSPTLAVIHTFIQQHVVFGYFLFAMLVVTHDF